MRSADVPALVGLATALRLSLGGVFLAAVLPKLRAPAAFASTVRGYGILPPSTVGVVALALTAVEGLLAVMLLGGWLPRVALPVAVATLLVFFMGVAVAVRRGRRVACGCFGSASEEVSPRTLVRLALLLLASAMLLASAWIPHGPQAATTTELLAAGAVGFRHLVEVVGLAGFVVLVAMWLLRLPELRAVVTAAGWRARSAGANHDADHGMEAV
jgi:hypothetical protein